MLFKYSWGYGWNFPTKFDMWGCKLYMCMIPLLGMVPGAIQVWLYGGVSKSLVSHKSVTSQKHWTAMIYPITLGWIVILYGPLLNSTSNYSKCNILFLLCLNSLRDENSYPMIPYHYRRRNSTIWGENTLIKHQKHHHHGGAVWCYSGMAMVN
jgi:hypothetical protein